MPPGQIRLPLNYDFYCSACPSEQLVTTLLKEAGCSLVQRLNASLQFHYEGAYGITIIYVAGYDESHDRLGNHPPKHAARFYVRANTDPRSQEHLQQVIAVLKHLPAPFLRTKDYVGYLSVRTQRHSEEAIV